MTVTRQTDDTGWIERGGASGRQVRVQGGVLPREGGANGEPHPVRLSAAHSQRSWTPDHTSRKREPVLLAWKGSDHMRRRSPCVRRHTPTAVSKPACRQEASHYAAARETHLQVGHGEQRQQGKGYEVQQRRLGGPVDPGGHSRGQEAWRTEGGAAEGRRRTSAQLKTNTPPCASD